MKEVILFLPRKDPLMFVSLCFAVTQFELGVLLCLKASLGTGPA